MTAYQNHREKVLDASQSDNQEVPVHTFTCVQLPVSRHLLPKVSTQGSDNVAIRLRELIVEKQSEYEYQVLEIMCDHVHLLLDVNPQIGIVKVVGKIKGYTAHALRKEFPVLKSRLPNLWTRSKFISSVGAVTLEVVKKYIEEQKGV